jgi:hypothetical protein
MQILCEVNQTEWFRRGIDAPRSTMKIEVDPAKFSEEFREFLADHLYEGDNLSARFSTGLASPSGMTRWFKGTPRWPEPLLGSSFD